MSSLSSAVQGTIGPFKAKRVGTFTVPYLPDDGNAANNYREWKRHLINTAMLNDDCASVLSGGECTQSRLDAALAALGGDESSLKGWTTHNYQSIPLNTEKNRNIHAYLSRKAQRTKGERKLFSLVLGALDPELQTIIETDEQNKHRSGLRALTYLQTALEGKNLQDNMRELVELISVAQGDVDFPIHIARIKKGVRRLNESLGGTNMEPVRAVASDVLALTKALNRLRVGLRAQFAEEDDDDESADRTPSSLTRLLDATNRHIQAMTTKLESMPILTPRMVLAITLNSLDKVKFDWITNHILADDDDPDPDDALRKIFAYAARISRTDDTSARSPNMAAVMHRSNNGAQSMADGTQPVSVSQLTDEIKMKQRMLAQMQRTNGTQSLRQRNPAAAGRFNSRTNARTGQGKKRTDRSPGAPCIVHYPYENQKATHTNAQCMKQHPELRNPTPQVPCKHCGKHHPYVDDLCVHKANGTKGAVPLTNAVQVPTHMQPLQYAPQQHTQFVQQQPYVPVQQQQHHQHQTQRLQQAYFGGAPAIQPPIYPRLSALSSPPASHRFTNMSHGSRPAPSGNQFTLGLLTHRREYTATESARLKAQALSQHNASAPPAASSPLPPTAEDPVASHLRSLFPHVPDERDAAGQGLMRLVEPLVGDLAGKVVGMLLDNFYEDDAARTALRDVLLRDSSIVDGRVGSELRDWIIQAVEVLVRDAGSEYATRARACVARLKGDKAQGNRAGQHQTTTNNKTQGNRAGQHHTTNTKEELAEPPLANHGKPSGPLAMLRATVEEARRSNLDFLAGSPYVSLNSMVKRYGLLADAMTGDNGPVTDPQRRADLRRSCPQAGVLIGEDLLSFADTRRNDFALGFDENDQTQVASLPRHGLRSAAGVLEFRMALTYHRAICAEQRRQMKARGRSRHRGPSSSTRRRRSSSCPRLGGPYRLVYKSESNTRIVRWRRKPVRRTRSASPSRDF